LEQVALPIGIKPKEVEISEVVLLNQADMLAAINLAVSSSGLQDNQIHPILEMEKAAFSKSLSGSNHFPAAKLDALCDVVGNEIILEWWAIKRGYKLVKLKSTLEEENELLKQQLTDAERENEIIKKFVKETS